MANPHERDVSSWDPQGRVWRAHIARTLPFAGNGVYRRGECDDEVVLLHELRKEEMYADDIARARRAIAICRRSEIRATATIRQLIDTVDNEHALVLVYEWAEEALHEALAAGCVTPADAHEVERNIAAALAALWVPKTRITESACSSLRVAV